MGVDETDTMAVGVALSRTSGVPDRTVSEGIGALVFVGVAGVAVGATGVEVGKTGKWISIPDTRLSRIGVGVEVGRVRAGIVILS